MKRTLTSTLELSMKSNWHARPKAVLVCFLIGCIGQVTTRAEELDQFTDRLVMQARLTDALSSSENPLDQRIQKALQSILHEARHGNFDFSHRHEAVKKALQHPIIPRLITPFSEWLIGEAPVKLYRPDGMGIYGGRIDFHDMRMAWYIGPVPVMKAGGVLQGTDKMGHFIGQGWQYYEKYLELRKQGFSETQAFNGVRDFGHSSEMKELGIETGGVYSYADLAANWQGFLFFRSLWEDAPWQVQHPYFKQNSNGHWELTRTFHWRTYITREWDEVLLPNRLASKRFYDHMVENFRRPGRNGTSVCSRYRKKPHLFMKSISRTLPLGVFTTKKVNHSQLPYSMDIEKICP